MLSFSNLQRKYQICPEKQLPDAHLRTAGHVTPGHQTPHVSGLRRADVVKTAKICESGKQVCSEVCPIPDLHLVFGRKRSAQSTHLPMTQLSLPCDLNVSHADAA